MPNGSIGIFVNAIVAAVLGFSGIAGQAAGIAQILFLVFLALAVISFFTVTGRRGVTRIMAPRSNVSTPSPSSP